MLKNISNPPTKGWANQGYCPGMPFAHGQSRFTWAKEPDPKHDLLLRRIKRAMRKIKQWLLTLGRK